MGCGSSTALRPAAISRRHVGGTKHGVWAWALSFTYPDAFPKVYGEIRRALVRRFPYAIYYQRLETDVLEIVACLHTSRQPKSHLDER